MSDQNWYMMWYSSKPVQDSLGDAIKKYISKYGYPPTSILSSPEEIKDIKPIDGYNVDVRSDSYVPVNILLVGVIQNEELEKSIRLEVETE